jgi:hypothetical protein
MANHDDIQSKYIAAQAEKIKNMLLDSGNNMTAPGSEVPLPISSFRERAENQAELARRENIHAARLSELAFLLDKNPEIARILELIDLVGTH